jgi:hypothetical protein
LSKQPLTNLFFNHQTGGLSMAKMRLPNGHVTTNDTIITVNLTPKGVVCQDARRSIIAWIPVTDPDKAKKVLDIMAEFAMAGENFPQPNWDFLD